MTELELQELAEKVIAKLRNESLTIDQLTQTNVLAGTDFLELNSGRKVSLDDLRKFIRGYGIYLEIISKLDNDTLPTDNNVFSSLRVLFEISKALEELKKIYIRKDQDDETRYFLQLLGGVKIGKSLTFGDFLTGVQGGIIGEDARAELESLVLRSSLSVPEIRFNRQTYFEGYNTISPGGGLKIKDIADNGDGSYTITPELEEGVPLGQYLDDILLGYWHDKSVTTGDFIGFQKVQYRVTSVDYHAKTFVMVPRPGYEFAPHKEMRLGQTGNFTNAERQTYIIIDVRDGNCCITYFDNANTWDPEPAQIKSWLGKKKGMKIAGIDCDNYSAVLQNIIMTGLIFQLDEITGDTVRVPIDKGAWVAGQYSYYNRVSHNGALWLCVNDKGTTSEPSESNPDWLKQVSEGKPGDTGPQGIPGPAGADGKPTYTWVRYADNAQGSGITNDPIGKSYIGFAYNKPTQAESNTPSDYTWSLIKGTDGVPGPPGNDGQTTYTWVAYSDYPDGREMYQIPNDNTGYLGIAVNKTTMTESNNPSDYTWSRFRGSDGLSVTGGGHWESSKTPYQANTLVSFANCVFLSNVETSNPPIRIARFKNGAFRRKKDGGYILAGKSVDWQVHPDWQMLLDGRELKGESFNFLGEFASHPANPENGDTYRNTTDHCTYTYKDGIWKVMLEDGTDGKDAKDYEWIYRRTNIIGLPPDKPESKQQDDYVPTGWTDDFLGVDQDHQVEWACKRTKRDGVWSEFSTPAVVHRWSKDGESNVMADLDNEVVSAALTSAGVTAAAQSWTTHASLSYGTEKLPLETLTVNAPAGFAVSTSKSLGAVAISVAAGKSLAEQNVVTITVGANKNGQLYTRELTFRITGIRGGADGSDAVLYSLVPSASSVKKDKNGNYSISSVSCKRMKTVGAVTTVTTDGELKYSRDGAAEVPIGDNIGVASGNFSKSLKFVYYVGGQVVDVETVPMMIDGGDGKPGTDGESIVSAGHWESAKTPYKANRVVEFAGGSYLSKVETSNPPIRIARFKNGNYRRKRDGGYILAGRSATRSVHPDWQQMVAPTDPSTSYWLDSPVSTINFTSTGTPSPSSFLVTCKQNVAGNISSCNTLYLAARKYNGSWLAHVGAQQTSQISVPATAGYTQFAVRAYKSAGDANAWNDSYVAEKGIGIAVDGKPGGKGDTGATGAFPRDRGVFGTNDGLGAYIWNADYRDKVIHLIGGVYYNFLVRNYGASVTAAPASANGDSNWEAMQKFVNIATDTLFATGAHIGGFMFVHKGINAQGVPYGEMRSQVSTDGVPNLLMNTQSGYFHCINADITGVINATSGSFSGKIDVGDFIIDGTITSDQGFYYNVSDTSKNKYGTMSIRPRMFMSVARDSLMIENNAQLNVFMYLQRARNNIYDRVFYASGISEFNGRVAISSYNAKSTTADTAKAALFVEGIMGVSDGLYGEPVELSSSCYISPLIGPLSGFKKNALIYRVTGNNITVDLQYIGDLCPEGTLLIFITAGTNNWNLLYAHGIYRRGAPSTTLVNITGDYEIWWVFFPEKQGAAYAGYLN